MVTADEIRRHSGRDLYEVLTILRPAWFRANPTRGGGSIVDQVAVYIDGHLMGGPSYLREIPVTGVLSVRYYSATEAQGRYGQGHLQGAIDVATTR